jgi:hypothetical protein
MKITTQAATIMLEALGYTVWQDWQDHFTHDVPVLTAFKGNNFDHFQITGGKVSLRAITLAIECYRDREIELLMDHDYRDTAHD